MTRREFTAATKVAAFKRAKGRCQECSRDLRPGDVFYDHIIADANGGEPTLDNCQCLCRVCHKLKTDLIDTPKAAETKRMEAKNLNARPAPAREIKGASFPVGKKRASNPTPLPPRRSLFRG